MSSTSTKTVSDPDEVLKDAIKKATEYFTQQRLDLLDRNAPFRYVIKREDEDILDYKGIHNTPSKFVKNLLESLKQAKPETRNSRALLFHLRGMRAAVIQFEDQEKKGT